MPLGIDATLRYGLHIPPTESLTQSELANPTPYNTRLHDGLPPTPINNPGMAALEAAAHPAKVDYLYFVRQHDHRHHYFTANYQDFLQHAAQYGHRGGAARPSGGALAVAPDAERGLRGGRAGLAVRPPRHRAPR